MNKREIDYCYHTHTFRCGHAEGTDEEFAQAAFDNGFKELGFTDHVILPDLMQAKMRGRPDEYPNYIASIRNIERQYEGRMNVHLGFECEWYGDRYRDYYQKILKNDVDYLILGQHCFLLGKDFIWYGSTYNDEEALYKYEEDLIEGMESGLFSFVAHPDHFMQWYPLWDDKCEKVARHILEKAVELNLPLEVNMGVSYRKAYKDRRDYLYPHPRFWTLAEEYPIDVLIGMDVHYPKYFKEGDIAWFIKFAKRHDLHLIDRISIKKKDTR